VGASVGLQTENRQIDLFGHSQTANGLLIVVGFVIADR
jgi:hypothetical protein